MENEPFEAPESNETPTDVTLSAMAFEAGLAFVALLLGDLFELSPLDTMQVSVGNEVAHLHAALWGVLATLPLLLMFLALDHLPLRIFRDLGKVVDERIIPLFSEATMPQLAMLAFTAGVGEELLFRGVLQDALTMHLGPPYGIVAGLVFASVVFGLCHSITRAYFVLATGMGLYLGLLFCWTNHLLAPIITHALYDFIVIAYLVRRKRQIALAP